MSVDFIPFVDGDIPVAANFNQLAQSAKSNADLTQVDREHTGQDRAAAAESAAAAALALSMMPVNPMTAAGDLIVGGTVISGVASPTRLAKGSSRQALQIIAGVPTWGSILTSIPIACSDESTLLAPGVNKVVFRMPYGISLTSVRASVTTAPAGGALVIDINSSGVSILSTKLTIDAGEKTSTTAAAPAVISNSSLPDDAEISIDIDAVGSVINGAGLKVYLIGVFS